MKKILAASIEDIKQQETSEIINEVADGYSEAPIELVEQESNAIDSEVENELNTNDRILDTVEALESLVEIISELPEDLSSTDQALIRNNIQMAVAGTDLPVEQFTPAVESFTTRTIAMEGIGDTIKRAAMNVFQSNDKILSRTEQRFTLFSMQVNKIESALDYVKYIINKSKDVGDEDVSIFLGKYILGRNGVVKNKKDFFTTYYQDTKDLDTLLNEVMASAKVVDGMLVNTAKSFSSPSKYKETLDNNYKTVRDEFLGKIAKSSIFKKANSTGGVEVFTTAPVLGMTQCVITLPDLKSTADAGSASVSSAIGKMNFQFVEQSKTAVQKGTEKVLFDKFSLKDLQDFVKNVESSLTVIKNFIESEARIIKNRRNLLRNTAKIYAAALYIPLGSVIGSTVGAVGAGGSALLLGAKAAGTIAAGATGSAGGAAVGGLALGAGVAKITDKVANASGWILGQLSNALRLQNKITRFYNNATNGVVEAITDHINLGYGVIDRGMHTFDYKD